jgi:hypothetical protein
VEILNAETALLRRQQYLVPRNQTASTRARVLPGPKESTAPLVDPVNDPTRKQIRTHIIRSKIIQNSVAQNETTASRQQVCAPTRETTVEGENKRSESGEGELCRRQGEPEVRLRESRDGASKGCSHVRRILRGNKHGDEARFVEVDGEARGGGEVVQDAFEGGGRSGGSLAEDEGIVRILEDGARCVGGEGVGEVTFRPGQPDKPLEDVGNDDKEVR